MTKLANPEKTGGNLESNEAESPPETAAITRLRNTISKWSSKVGPQIQSLERLGGDQESQAVEGLRDRVITAVGTLYKSVKRHSGIGILCAYAFFSGADTYVSDEMKVAKLQALSEQSIAKTIKPEDLPTSIAFVDYLFEHQFTELYNKFATYKNSRISGQMSTEETRFREQIVDNVEPAGYGLGNLNSFSNRLKGFRENKKELSADAIKKREIDRGKEFTFLKIRHDLFRKYLGLDSKFNTLEPAQHKPTKATNPDTEYFQFHTENLVSTIKQSIALLKEAQTKMPHKALKDEMLLDQSKIDSFEDLIDFVSQYQQLPKCAYTNQLGHYKAYIGKDEHGTYVSAADYWNLEPEYLKEYGINIDQFNHPFWIYFRLYEEDWEKQ